MKIEYDPEADAAYIEIRHGDVARTEQIDDVTLVDVDAAGRAIGVEILHVARRVKIAQSAS